MHPSIELERGEHLKPELEKAITQSAVSVIVFSESYASSTWCLDEVLAIIERNKSSNHQVIPVFYKVEPSDVRKQKRSFAEAFGRYDSKLEAETNQEKKKEWMKKVKAWREALTEAANLAGMVLADRPESKFIKEIVQVVEKKLNRRALYVAEHLVGRSDIIARIDSSLRDGSANAAAIHVIYGIGGIGKTTIAKCIYNLHYRNFEASCFLSDVREKSNQPNGLPDLQTQLLSTIRNSQKKEKIWNVYEGIIKVKHAICNKRVLIVLDDVTEIKQLEALLGPQEFYPGSKIILATRHKRLLNALRVRYEVHPIKKLRRHESLKLFSLHAFQQDHPEEAYFEQSKVIVDRCGGLPLALKVLGRSLVDESIAHWEDTMRKLKAIPNAEIHEKLQISYESLKNEDKDLFLHIACFFTGEDKDYIVTILKHCGLYPVVGIQQLIDRCLLEIENNKLMMHQLIQEMGREIVRQESPKDPGERSRLWHHEDSFDVLRENTGTKKIEGLVLDMNMLKKDELAQSMNQNYSTEKGWYEKLFNRSFVPSWMTAFTCANEEALKIDAFEKMDKLMILKLNYVRLTGSYQKLPKKLRLLCWHGFPLKSIPIGIPLEKLVALNMCYSKLEQVWKGFKMLKSLKILNLSYSEELVKTPDFKGLPSLESLILKGCVSLVEVGESITNLKGLVFLDIEDCKSLRNIPSLPTSLVTLKMSSCQNLCGVGEVKRWPSLPHFLVRLSIEGCNLSDDSFPRDFSHLLSLRRLNLSNNYITTLPDCIINLSNLEILDLDHCPKLQLIQGLPIALHHLSIRGNTSLEEMKALPDTFCDMNFYRSTNLNAVEDCFKRIPIDKVDRKIIKNMGIESLPLTRIQLMPIKVLYEFGIFSTYVPGRELPSCFMYKEMGSKISFRVPSLPDNRRIHGLNVCFLSNGECVSEQVEVRNKTKGFKWIYHSLDMLFYNVERVWLSLWKCGNLLEGEDEVDVEIFGVNEAEVQCCINFVYEDEISEEDRNGEAEKEENHHNHLSWKDKMRVELSTYKECGTTYCFSNRYAIFRLYEYDHYDKPEYILFVDWMGREAIV